MKRFLAVAAAVLGIILITGCATSGGKVKKAVPAGRPDKGIVSRLTGKTWLLAGYAPDGAFLPLEPEHGTSAMLILNPDGSLEGSTGWNDFSGSWTVRGKTAKGEYPSAIRIGKTSRDEPPNDIAARFDRDVQRLLGKASSLKEGQNSFVLLDSAGEIILRYIFRKAQ